MGKAQSYTIPAPIGGLNARDSEDTMEEVYALDMLNWFPQPDSLELRKGYRVHSHTLGGSVQTLVEYVKVDGTRQLIAAADGEIWNATTFNVAATSLGSGFTSNQWQTVNAFGKLVLFNGADTPQQWDGTTLSNATYTGIGTPANLIQPHIYRNRLYVVEKDTTKVWYGATSAVTGALTSYDVGGFLKKGGYILFAGSFSQATGDLEADRFVVVSNLGEVLVYSGIDPGNAAWSLVGRFYAPNPRGRRAFFNKDAEMAIISDQGVIPVSQLLTSAGSLSDSNILTDNIRNKFRKDAINYAANFGWEGVVFPRGNMVIINIPIATLSKAKQYVLNTLTGAWTEFSNVNAICWAVHNEKPYFGASDGKVYEFNFGNNDNDNTIPTKLRFALNYFGNRANTKRLLQANPRIRSTGDMEFLFGADTDHEIIAISDSITTIGTSGTPWGSPWGSPWAGQEIDSSGWQQVSGVGRGFALRMEGSFKGVTGSLRAVNIMYETGGFM